MKSVKALVRGGKEGQLLKKITSKGYLEKQTKSKQLAEQEPVHLLEGAMNDCDVKNILPGVNPRAEDGCYPTAVGWSHTPEEKKLETHSKRFEHLEDGKIYVGKEKATWAAKTNLGSSAELSLTLGPFIRVTIPHPNLNCTTPELPVWYMPPPPSQIFHGSRFDF